MGRVIIDQQKCKGCAICEAMCPFQLLHINENTLNQKGFHPMENIDMEKCTGCAICAIMCPDACIRVER